MQDKANWPSNTLIYFGNQCWATRQFKLRFTKYYATHQVSFQTKPLKCSLTRLRTRWSHKERQLAKLSLSTLLVKILTISLLLESKHLTYCGKLLWWKSQATLSYYWSLPVIIYLTCCEHRKETLLKITFLNAWWLLDRKQERVYRQLNLWSNYWIRTRSLNLSIRTIMGGLTTTTKIYPLLSKTFASNIALLTWCSTTLKTMFKAMDLMRDSTIERVYGLDWGRCSMSHQ